MLWAWEVVGKQSLVETWCMRIGNGESSASGVKESALNVWHAILLWPLPSGPRGTETRSFVSNPVLSLDIFLVCFFLSNIFLKNLLCGDWYCIHLPQSAVTAPISSCPAHPQPQSRSLHRATWENWGRKVRESRNCCNHFRWNPSQIGTHLHLCWRFSMLNSDKPQVEVPFTHLCLCTACCLLRLCVARAR